MATFEVVGVYKIAPTLESVVDAAHYHGCDFLLDSRGHYKDEIHWDSLGGLALVEVQIQGEFSSEELDSIAQGEQAPYMEFYLERTGTRVISEDQAIKANERHVCFFLHFVDTTRPLAVGGAELRMPSVSELPERLNPYAHYLPVD